MILEMNALTMGKESGKKLSRKPWSATEDKALKELIELKLLTKDNNWSDIAQAMEVRGFRRTSKQCRERWCYNLDPTIRREPFTEEEDNVLRNFHALLGNKWASIAKHLPGRTENSVKTRYKSLIRAQKRAWKKEEDDKLSRLYKIYGSNWKKISSHFKNRTSNAVKTRFKVLKNSSVIKYEKEWFHIPEAEEEGPAVPKPLGENTTLPTPSVPQIPSPLNRVPFNVNLNLSNNPQLQMQGSRVEGGNNQLPYRGTTAMQRPYRLLTPTNSVPSPQQGVFTFDNIYGPPQYFASSPNFFYPLQMISPNHNKLSTGALSTSPTGQNKRPAPVAMVGEPAKKVKRGSTIE